MTGTDRDPGASDPADGSSPYGPRPGIEPADGERTGPPPVPLPAMRMQPAPPIPAPTGVSRTSKVVLGTLAALFLVWVAVVAVTRAGPDTDYSSWRQDPYGEYEAVPPPMPVQDAEHAPDAVTPEIARAAAQHLLDAAVAAAGPDTQWTSYDGADDWTTRPVLIVTELPCSDGRESGVLYDLPHATFRTGVITDTTTDEHDREVQAGNEAAAERIAAAWSELGYTRDEALGGDILFGGAPDLAVERVEIDFTFGYGVLIGRGLCVAD